MAIPEDEWELPVAISSSGETLSLRTAAKLFTGLGPSKGEAFALAKKLQALDPTQQERLVVARLRSRGDLRIAALGGQPIDLEEAVAEVEGQSPLGRKLMKIELGLVGRFVAEALSTGEAKAGGGAEAEFLNGEH